MWYSFQWQCTIFNKFLSLIDSWALTIAISPAAIPISGLTATTTKVSFHPPMNPTMKPNTNVESLSMKIDTWSAMALLILLTSLQRNGETIQCKTFFHSSQALQIRSPNSLWYPCIQFTNRVAVKPADLHSHYFPEISLSHSLNLSCGHCHPEENLQWDKISLSWCYV